MVKPLIIALPNSHEKGHPAWLGVFLLCLALITPVCQASGDRSLREHEAQLKTLKQRIESIDAELTEDRETHSSESKKLRKTEQEISERLAALRQINSQIEEQTAATKQLQKQQKEATAELAHQRLLLAGQLRASYANGRQEKVKLLLNQGDPAQVGRLLGYHEYLTTARTQRMAWINEQAKALAELEAVLARKITALQTLREIQRAQLDQLEVAKHERSQQIAELEREMAESGKALAQIQSEENALQKLITAIRKQLSDIPAEFRNSKPLSEARGELPWPLKGQLLARYGQKKHGTSLQWDGIWIGAKAGTPVRAVAGGRVVYVGRMHRYGLLIITEHSDGYYSLYGHNQEPRVSVGDEIKAGHIIAYAGDSGGHKQSGLYFEIRKGRKTVNPSQWLSRR
ncbi:MAG: murein hydrolase activator EnvC family protein [Nevskiales bacterium]